MHNQLPLEKRCHQMSRTLDPTHYKCTTHNEDLTAEVNDAVATLYPASSIGASMRDEVEASDKGDFTVIVNCPGVDKEHPLTFSGTYTS